MFSISIKFRNFHVFEFLQRNRDIPYYRSNDVYLVVFRVNRLQSAGPTVAAVDGRADFLAYSRRKHDVIFLLTPDVVGLGLPNDNNFQPVTSFVSITMLGNDSSRCNLSWIRRETGDSLSLRIHLPILLGSIQTAGLVPCRVAVRVEKMVGSKL